MTKEQLGDLLWEDINNLQEQLGLKIHVQTGNKLKTDKGEFKLQKIHGFQLNDLDVINNKIHHIYNPNGCIIAGKIIIEAMAEVPNSDGAMVSRRIFEVNFNNTMIEFNFDSEKFTVNEVNILYALVVH